MQRVRNLILVFDEAEQQRAQRRNRLICPRCESPAHVKLLTAEEASRVFDPSIYKNFWF